VTVFERGASNFGPQDAQPELQLSNLLLLRMQISALLLADQPKSGTTNAIHLTRWVKGAHRNAAAAADTQSICGAARQKPATSSYGIFLIGHVVTHRGMAKAEYVLLQDADEHCRKGRDGATASRRAAYASAHARISANMA
jgi:hypothetical protein